MKIVFLEGLPGVGKTTILNYIRDLNIKEINLVGEILDYKFTYKTRNKTQFGFKKNDERKVSLYQKGNTVIDRGPISTLAYNFSRHIIDKNFKQSLQKTEKWFEKKFKKVYQSENSHIIFLKRTNDDFFIPSKNINDPYGDIENQKLLEKVTLFLSKKYSKNVTIIEYDKQNIQDVVNEIISKFMLS